MKKFITLMAIMGAGAMTVHANTDAHIRPPGFKQRMQTQVKETVRKPFAMSSKHLVAAPPQYVMRTTQAEEMETVERLIKADYSQGGWESSYTFEYDKYGFFAKWQGSNGSYIDYNYTWHIPGKVWASKRVDYYDSDGTSHHTETNIKRTFHPNGSVATNTVIDMWGNRSVSEYDEQGNLLKLTSINGEDTNITTYTYFPLTGIWIRGEENDYHKIVVELDGDYGFIIREMRLDDNVWRIISEEGKWYDKEGKQTGNMYLYYNYNDDKVSISGYGDRNKIEENDDSKIYISERLKENDGNIVMENGRPKWFPSYKWIYSKNYDNPWIYNPGEVRVSESFTYSNGAWEAVSKATYIWVKDGVVKEDYKDFRTSEILYYMVTDDLELTDDIYYDEATGRYGVYELDDDYYYYTYYEADGQPINQFRKTYNDDDYGNTIETWEVWKNNSWQKCTGNITVYEDSDDKYLITFDSQSRVLVFEEYEFDKFKSRTEYTYTNNGYVEKEYDLDEMTGKPYLSEEYTYTLENGNPTSIYFSYDNNGNIDYCYKSVKDTQNKVDYHYNHIDGEWVFNSGSANALVETLADGTTIRINRKVMGYGNVVNTSKEIELDSPNRKLSERYDWNAERGDWDGVWKRAIVKPQTFSIIEPVDPQTYEDEYFFPVSDEVSIEREEWYEGYWYWDSSSNDWVVSRPLPEFSYPDEYTCIIKNVSEDKEFTETTIVDNQRRKIEHSTAQKSVDDVRTTRHTWTYDDKGRLVNDTEIRTNGELWSYDYHYGPIQIVNSIEEVISSATSLTVYNLQGVCVLRAASPEAVKQLPRGLYIVNGKKVVIR